MIASQHMARLRRIASAATTLCVPVGRFAESPLCHSTRHAIIYHGSGATDAEKPSHGQSSESRTGAAARSRSHDAGERGDGEAVQTTFGSVQHSPRATTFATSPRPNSTSGRIGSAKNMAARSGGSDKVSGAALAAAIMRRHRVHTSFHHLSISSGVEVPECDGGAYHLQERPSLRHSAVAAPGAAGSGGYGRYLSRSRSCAHHTRISIFPAASLRPASGNDPLSSSRSPSHGRSASPSLSSANAAQASPVVLQRNAAHLRAQQYEPFDRLLHRYLERGHVAHVTQRLLHHPDAPAPAVLLDTILQHRIPAPSFVCQALLATMHTARRDRSTAAAAGFALDRVALRLRADENARLLYQTPEVRALLLEATLQESLYDTAVDVVMDMPVAWITPHAWSQLVIMAGQSKLPYSQLLWRLLSLHEGASTAAEGSSSRDMSAPAQSVLTRAGESALLGALRPHSHGVAPTAVHIRDVAATGAPVLSGVPPLDAIEMPGGVLDTRACATVLAPVQNEIGGAVFDDSAVASEVRGIDEGDEERTELASESDRDQSSATSVAAVVPSAATFITSSGGGVQWRALGAVELGYAVEHHNSDASPAAGGFRACGAAGVLYSHSSFQALLAEVERDGVLESSDASASSQGARARALWETTALRMINMRHGVAYGLDAAMTARVLLRCGISFAAHASPLLALHVLRRYLRSCRLLRDQVVAAQRLVEAQLDAAAKGTQKGGPTTATATTAMGKSPADLYPRLARAVMPHPAPFLVFFKVMREARDVLSHAVDGGDEDEAVAALSAARRYRGAAVGVAGRSRASLPVVHWEIVWHTFQELNRENPLWYTQLELKEAGDLCLDVLEVLCHGADPWLTLNVARRVSAGHIIDGIDMSLWLLNRLEPSHHTDEARDVARKLFRWLLADVGVHVQPPLHRHLVPVARALIRLGLQKDMSTLYSAVLDNVVLFAAEHRDAFIHVLRDLICPACSSVLPESDVYVDRVCPNCMAVLTAKDANTIPTFRLSAEHVERWRAQRKQRRQRTQQRLSASVRRLQHSGEEGSTSNIALRRPPRDAADVLRWHLQKRDCTEPGGAEGPLDVSLASSSSLLMATSASSEAPLVPGVSVSTDLVLFPVSGGAASGVQVLDIRAAMEESSRRLELQRAARQYALAQRGVCDVAGGRCDRYADASGVATGTASPSASLTVPTTLPVSAQALDASTLKYFFTAANAATEAAPRSAASDQTADGAWVCVWCQENNSEWTSRVQCGACGADTGPAAPWRRFAYAAASGDVMDELRGRMSNCEARPVDAIVAGYLLMVYRRTFQLRATPADQDRLLRLVQVLCQLQERVLAGYVYTRLVPISQRRLGMPLPALAQVFGQELSLSYRALTQADLTRPDADGAVFQALFGAQTCRVCFGQHDWHVCPIVTRNFVEMESGAGEGGQRRTPISLSPEEKQRAALERLSQLIHQAVASLTPSAAESASTTSSFSSASPSVLLPPGKPNAQLVVDVYTAFVSSPFREMFAERLSDDANRLSLLLSRVQQYRRAAFVLCHVPPPQRATEAYLRMVHYFNVTEAEALALLEEPSTSTRSKGQAVRRVNFVQVTQTCCMCLDARHASHECPRLEEWLKGVQHLALSGKSGGSTAGALSSSAALLDIEGDARLRRRLKAQVDGWTTAGPERLHAFYRYLISHIDLLRPVGFASTDTAELSAHRRADFHDPLIYAVNRVITKLSVVGRRSETYRLYTHTPVEYVSAATTAAVLHMNGFSDESAHILLTSASSSDEGAAAASDSATFATIRSTSVFQHAPLAARTAAVPVRECCFLCFSTGHTFVECPELTAASTEVERLLLVLRNVAGIACVPDGIGAAAAYVYSEYNCGRLSADMMRSNPELIMELLTLTRRCFATRQLSHGVRVLRRVPIEVVPPETIYMDLWRAAGLSEADVESKQAQLLGLLDAESVRPSIDPAPPRPTYTNTFLSQFSRILHDGLCRHCYEHDHTIATCPRFHAEVSFGRDYVAAYRMSMMSEQLDRAWQEAYLLKLVDFFATHYLFMPYHITGVSNALNAIASMWSFRGEPGIAQRHLLRIPPAYRRRQAFKHVLHCLRVPPAEITKLMGDFFFAPDSNPAAAAAAATAAPPQQHHHHAQQQREMVMAQHLLLPKPAIRDVARKQIFDRIPAAVVSLEESEERMAEIRSRHERRSRSSGGITAEVRERLDQPQRDPSGRHRAEVTDASSPHAAASFHSPVLQRIMQSGDIAQLREDFDPILAELEDAVGMKLGSRHTLFTSAVELLSTAGSAPPSSPVSGSASSNVNPDERGDPRASASPAAASSSPAVSQTQEAVVLREMQRHHSPSRRPGSSADQSQSSRQQTSATEPVMTSFATATRAAAALSSERSKHHARRGDGSKLPGASQGRSANSNDGSSGRERMSGYDGSAGHGRMDRRDARGRRNSDERAPASSQYKSGVVERRPPRP
ncbi:hypothetical protein JKF63_07140 [Porcisia hertigi]|uniref:CCHC-type domain-containing protein n=1 Tax=Porcisia hertigi TaxID=2761500 RepID=A0A836LKE4_9TRYP|nr:hypothetical protein JKF63_07140 [Porcisia hertigi]